MLDRKELAPNAAPAEMQTLLLAPVKARRSGPSITPVVPPPTKSEQRSRTTQLRLPTGERDLQALMAVIDDWLVPLLVTEFLAEYGAGVVVAGTNANQRTTKPL
jgi:hypothetical protein